MPRREEASLTCLVLLPVIEGHCNLSLDPSNELVLDGLIASFLTLLLDLSYWPLSFFLLCSFLLSISFFPVLFSVRGTSG